MLEKYFDQSKQITLIWTAIEKLDTCLYGTFYSHISGEDIRIDPCPISRSS